MPTAVKTPTLDDEYAATLTALTASKKKADALLQEADKEYDSAQTALKAAEAHLVLMQKAFKKAEAFQTACVGALERFVEAAETISEE